MDELFVLRWHDGNSWWYYRGTEEKGHDIFIKITKLVEHAYTGGFQAMGLLAQKPEMNAKMEISSYHTCLKEEVINLRARLE